MRLLVALSLIALGFAGCLAEAPVDDQSLEPVPESSLDPADFWGPDDPVFCGGNVACDFDDDAFHQYVVYDLDTTKIDVLVLPPGGMSTPDFIAASRQAAQAWSDGVEHFGAPWFTEAFEMTVSAVGVDVPDISMATDPEIVIISSAAVGIVGIGLEPKQFGCIILGEDALATYDGHYHGDTYLYAQDCTGIGFTCFAINVGAADTRGLYDLIAHEVGHCLGPGHVGDALDFKAKRAPVEDIMSYQDNPEQVHCVSNMNVRVMEGVYAHLLDRPEEEFLPRGSYLEFNPWDYAQIECENPPGM